MNRNPITRRDFVRSTASLSLCLATQARGVIALPVPQSSGPVLTPAPFTVHYRQQPQYESLVPYIDPGHDAFPIEKEAAEITSHLKRLVETLTIPISSSFQGFSPVALHSGHGRSHSCAETAFSGNHACLVCGSRFL